MANLDVFFNPKNVAVIGASRTPGKIGYAILESLKHSFKGKIYPINPYTTEILGLEVFPSLKEIDDKIDLAVIAVKAESVKQAVEECIKKKIAGVIIISSGFSEIGRKDLELELKKFKKSIRMVGPNCVGTFSATGFDNMFLDRKKLKRPSDGQIDIISQSGAIGASLLDVAANDGVGVSKFISIGNKIDVDEVELLEYFGKDMLARCIVMYIESTERGADLISVAKKIKTPIVVFKSGKTARGNDAVVSHTGALAGSGEVFSSALKQAGIVEAETIEDIFDYSKILSTQPVLKDNRLAIITDGGGLGIVTVDAAVKSGFDVVALSKETETKLRNGLPKYASSKNPVDLTGGATSETYEKAITEVMKDKNVSGIICITLFQVPGLDDEVLEVLKDAKITGKPFVVCAQGGEYTLERAKKLEKAGIPVYPTPERAVRAMKCLLDYGKISKK